MLRGHLEAKGRQLRPTFTPRWGTEIIPQLGFVALGIIPLVRWGLQGMPLILHASPLMAVISVSVLSISKSFIKVLPGRTPLEKPKAAGSLRVF